MHFVADDNITDMATKRAVEAPPLYLLTSCKLKEMHVQQTLLNKLAIVNSTVVGTLLENG